MRLATCPDCGRNTETFHHSDRRIYTHHMDRNGGTCTASGWLTEDTELLPTKPRKHT